MSYYNYLPKELRLLLLKYINYDNKRLLSKLVTFVRVKSSYALDRDEISNIFNQYKLKTIIDYLNFNGMVERVQLNLVVDEDDIFTDEFIKDFLKTLCFSLFDCIDEDPIHSEKRHYHIGEIVADLNMLLKKYESVYRVVVYSFYSRYDFCEIVKI